MTAFSVGPSGQTEAMALTEGRDLDHHCHRHDRDGRTENVSYTKRLTTDVVAIVSFDRHEFGDHFSKRHIAIRVLEEHQGQARRREAQFWCRLSRPVTQHRPHSWEGSRAGILSCLDGYMNIAMGETEVPMIIHVPYAAFR